MTRLSSWIWLPPKNLESTRKWLKIQDPILIISWSRIRKRMNPTYSKNNSELLPVNSSIKCVNQLLSAHCLPSLPNQRSWSKRLTFWLRLWRPIQTKSLAITLRRNRNWLKSLRRIAFIITSLNTWRPVGFQNPSIYVLFDLLSDHHHCGWSASHLYSLLHRTWIRTQGQCWTLINEEPHVLWSGTDDRISGAHLSGRRSQFLHCSYHR